MFNKALLLEFLGILEIGLDTKDYELCLDTVTKLYTNIEFDNDCPHEIKIKAVFLIKKLSARLSIDQKITPQNTLIVKEGIYELRKILNLGKVIN